MRKNNITAREAVRLNIHHLLLQAPRKYRMKYGKRREISDKERTMTNRQRNREHARATRMRRKIFKEVITIINILYLQFDFYYKS